MCRRSFEKGVFLTLGVLRGTTCLVQTGLLALHRTGIAGEETSLLQGRAIVDVELVKSTGDREAESTGLAGGAATLEVGLDVELTVALEKYERGQDILLVQLVGDVLLQATAVAGDLAGASNHGHTDDGALTATDGLNRVIQLSRGENRSLSGGVLGSLGSDGITDGGGELLGCSLSGSNVFCGSNVRLVGLYVLYLLYVLFAHCATCLIS